MSRLEMVQNGPRQARIHKSVPLGRCSNLECQSIDDSGSPALASDWHSLPKISTELLSGRRQQHPRNTGLELCALTHMCFSASKRKPRRKRDDLRNVLKFGFTFGPLHAMEKYNVRAPFSVCLPVGRCTEKYESNAYARKIHGHMEIEPAGRRRRFPSCVLQRQVRIHIRPIACNAMERYNVRAPFFMCLPVAGRCKENFESNAYARKIHGHMEIEPPVVGGGFRVVFVNPTAHAYDAKFKTGAAEVQIKVRNLNRFVDPAPEDL
ncbi:hypothetical protein C8R45DRAFT_922012 [Mycena sanguinolenta]|nr:hypothetical protein C8R45DRAFT_922012 [Mycena sanguinolenta]